MGFSISRQQRILCLLIIDSIFFLVEIIIGYTANSLALIADSFHMLNDVLSLVVALYAIKLAARTNFSSQYSYGWQRAEVLGALVNGIFLIALCFTLFIEAIERFIEGPEVKQPKLVVVVGSLGLASNIIGLLLFHEHGHSHSHSHSSKPTPTVENEPTTPASLDNIYVHPAQTRQSVVRAAQEIVEGAPEIADGVVSEDSEEEELEIEVNTQEQSASSAASPNHAVDIPEQEPQKPRRRSSTTKTHEGKGDHAHGHHHHHHDHSKGNLNMHGVFLHVLGDALGNIGVVATALFIWLSPWSWRHYTDPAVSLLITAIILTSSLPLVRSASYILLQSVPQSVKIDDVREEILKKVPEIISVHDFHIWQLTDTKLIASVHILLRPSTDYMSITARIRNVMHKHGIHSTTIQPEFIESNDGNGKSVHRTPTGQTLVANELGTNESDCLLRCTVDDTCREKVCCPTSNRSSNNGDRS